MMVVVNHHCDDDGEYQEAFISSKLSFSLSLSLTLSLTTRSIIIYLLMLSVIMLLFYEYKK